MTRQASLAYRAAFSAALDVRRVDLDVRDELDRDEAVAAVLSALDVAGPVDSQVEQRQPLRLRDREQRDRVAGGGRR